MTLWNSEWFSEHTAYLSRTWEGAFYSHKMIDIEAYKSQLPVWITCYQPRGGPKVNFTLKTPNKFKKILLSVLSLSSRILYFLVEDTHIYSILTPFEEFFFIEKIGKKDQKLWIFWKVEIT